MSRERRDKVRVESQEAAVAVQLGYAGADAPERGGTVFCSTGDLSTHGLQLIVDKPVPVNTPLRVTVVFQNPPHHFEHVGYVRWVSEDAESGSYALGIEFTEQHRAQLYAWREFLEATFPEALADEIASDPTP